MANAGLLSRDQIAGVIQKVRTAIFSKANTTPISIRQNASLKGEAPEIAPWVSHVELPAPPSEQDGVQQLLLKAIETLGQGNEQYVVPSLQRIQAQWTSATSNLPPGINQMERSDEAKYHSMMDKVTCRVTILYVHGGAFV